MLFLAAPDKEVGDLAGDLAETLQFTLLRNLSLLEFGEPNSRIWHNVREFTTIQQMV